MKNIYEVFDEVAKETSRQKKIEILRNNDSYALRNVLKGSFDKDIQFVIERVPYYKPSDSPPGMGYSSMTQELGRAYLFEKNNPRVSPNLSSERREQILIQILEALEAKEAEVYMNMLLKKQKVKGLTESLVKEAFPGLIS